MGLFNKEKVQDVPAENITISSATVDKKVPIIDQGSPEIGYFSGDLTPFGNLKQSFPDRRGNELIRDKKLVRNLIASSFVKKLNTIRIGRDVGKFHYYDNVIVENLLSGHIKNSTENQSILIAENSKPLQIIPVCEKCRSVPVVEIQVFVIYAGQIIFYCRNHKDRSDETTMPLQEFFEYFPEYSVNFVKHMKDFTPTVIETDKKMSELRFVEYSDTFNIKRGIVNDLRRVDEAAADVQERSDEWAPIPSPVLWNVESHSVQTPSQVAEESNEASVKRDAADFDKVVEELNTLKNSSTVDEVFKNTKVLER